jgi:toxin ParE1/3/4
MKLPVEESDFVFCDVQDIVRYLRKRRPSAADRFVPAFQATVDQIGEMPQIGRTRADLGAPEIRSWRVATFHRHLVFYEVLPDRVRLLRVLHGARDLQAELYK